MNAKTEKKNIRNTVRVAISLYEQNEISSDILQTIAASAMAWEITTGIQKKLEKKMDDSSKLASLFKGYANERRREQTL
jgi:hypothetical protein